MGLSTVRSVLNEAGLQSIFSFQGCAISESKNCSIALKGKLKDSNILVQVLTNIHFETIRYIYHAIKKVLANIIKAYKIFKD